MTTALTHNKDALAGLLFTTLGAAALYMSRGYLRGDAQEMGPGYLPQSLAVVLMLFGVALFVRGMRRPRAITGGWAFKPLALLAAAMLVFGFAIERVGLVPALVLLFLLAARAGDEFKLGEVLLLTTVMCIFSVAVFIWGLQLPYALFAWRF